ncbi:hypothetical protein ACSNOI_35450 [Actinomadura kijaniata]|uniref:hypothetical protein n=1 Tax=Actinomadura kijaniata TaxID=46161 RepID=UPI003F1E1184
MIADSGPGPRPEGTAASVFLRFDPPEPHEGVLVVRAARADLRERRRPAAVSPLGRLYEQAPPGEPERDLALDAGRYGQDALVRDLSGEVTGIAGITEPSSPETPAGKEEQPCPTSSPETPC